MTRYRMYVHPFSGGDDYAYDYKTLKEAVEDIPRARREGVVEGIYRYTGRGMRGTEYPLTSKEKSMVRELTKKKGKTPFNPLFWLS